MSSPIGFDNIRVSNISSNEVTIVGSTAIPVNCNIEYGTNGNFPNIASDNDAMKMPHTEHFVIISDLDPNTKYNYRFAVEYDSQMYRSNIGVFQTTPSAAPMSLLPEQ